MSPRRHSADLLGRRYDLGIGVRDMAAGLGFGLGRLLSIEDDTGTEGDKTFYRTWLSRIEGDRAVSGMCSWGARAQASGSHKLRAALHVWLVARLKNEIATYEKYVDGSTIASWTTMKRRL